MPNRKTANRYKRFRFNYSDYSRLTGLKVDTLRKYAYLGKFDPYDIVSVCKFAWAQNEKRGPER